MMPLNQSETSCEAPKDMRSLHSGPWPSGKVPASASLLSSFRCNGSYPTIIFGALIITLMFLLMCVSNICAQQRKRQAGKPAQQSGPGNIRSLPQMGQSSERELKGTEAHYYQVNLPRQQYMRVIINQRGIDVEVTLLNEHGAELAKADNANGTRGEEEISLLAESDEVYSLKVSPVEEAPTPGRYDIRLDALRLATQEDRKQFVAENAFAAGERLRKQETAHALNQAIDKYEEARQQWQEINDERGVATALLGMGKAYYYASQMQEAIDAYRKALSHFEAASSSWDEAVAYLDLGITELAISEDGAALNDCQRALQLFDIEGDQKYKAFALYTIGRIYYLEGDVNGALEHYRQALPLRQALNDRKGEAFTLDAIGRVYFYGFDDEEQALTFYEQSLKLAQDIGYKTLVAQVMDDMGRLHFTSGDYTAALKQYREALAVIKDGDLRTRAETLLYIGMVYAAQGQYQEALDKYFGEALKLQRQTHDIVGEGYTIHQMGAAYFPLGNYEKALELLNQALRTWQKVLYRTAEADTRYSIARIESRHSNLMEARAQLEAALPLVDALRTKIANQSLRTSYFAAVQKYYELYIDVLMRLSKQTHDRKMEALALSVSESKRGRALLDTLIEVRADMRQGISPALLERERAVQQQISAQSLRQMISGSLNNEQAGQVRQSLNSLLLRYYEIEAEIRQQSQHYAGLNYPTPPTLEKIQTELLNQDQMLLEYSLGEEQSYLWAVTATSIESYVLPGRAEIETLANRLRTLLTERNRLVKDETELEAKHRIEKADEQYQDAAAALSRMLKLDQGRSVLPAARLLIVSDGELQYLPFASLPVPLRNEDKNSPTLSNISRSINTVPLLVYHEIETQPSMSLIAELKRERADTGRPKLTKTIAVIADPVFNEEDERYHTTARRRSRVGNQGNAGRPLSSDLSNPSARRSGSAAERAASEVGATDEHGHIARLGFTWLESQQILSLVSPAQRLEALGFDANRALVTDGNALGQYRILHFATHGLLNNEHPELSGIMLSMIDERGRPQNGFLQMHQIYNLRLPAELVVLSACQTGVSKRIKGDGLAGLSRGFMYAGARRVVATLWEVHDASTSELMKYFYENLRIWENSELTKVRPAAALRAAQLQMWQQKLWRSPYYWAGFIIQGESN